MGEFAWIAAAEVERELAFLGTITALKTTTSVTVRASCSKQDLWSQFFWGSVSYWGTVREPCDPDGDVTVSTCPIT
jgi:hypothetical protein